MKIEVMVAGTTGKMGQEVVRLLERTDDMELVATVSRSGTQVGQVPAYSSVEEALTQQKADVLVDFTAPEVVKDHMKLAIRHRVRPVIGTSGLSEEELQDIVILSQESKVGVVVAPNFAIGAVLMMKFAAQAAKYLPYVEIIESHHDRKIDAPSGTSIKTAEMIAESRKQVRQGHPQEIEIKDGARGAYYNGFRIHSVRLPGLVAHQEVLFGDGGQLLTLRHDSLQRESFMPGVQLAIEKVMNLDHLVYGLENLLELS